MTTLPDDLTTQLRSLSDAAGWPHIDGHLALATVRRRRARRARRVVAVTALSVAIVAGLGVGVAAPALRDRAAPAVTPAETTATAEPAMTTTLAPGIVATTSDRIYPGPDGAKIIDTGLKAWTGDGRFFLTVAEDEVGQQTVGLYSGGDTTLDRLVAGVAGAPIVADAGDWTVLRSPTGHDAIVFGLQSYLGEPATFHLIADGPIGPAGQQFTVAVPAVNPYAIVVRWSDGVNQPVYAVTLHDDDAPLPDFPGFIQYQDGDGTCGRGSSCPRHVVAVCTIGSLCSYVWDGASPPTATRYVPTATFDFDEVQAAIGAAAPSAPPDTSLSARDSRLVPVPELDACLAVRTRLDSQAGINRPAADRLVQCRWDVAVYQMIKTQESAQPADANLDTTG